MKMRRMRLFSLLFILPLYACGGGGGSSPPPPPVSITVAPKSATVAPGKTQQFTATVTGSPDENVIWQVNSTTGGTPTVGMISTDGLYTAPANIPNPPAVSVTAVAEADSSKTAIAVVTIAKPSGSANQAMQAFPIKLGTSGGDAVDSSTSGNTITCCSGTLGSLVKRGATPTFFILSNNHVLARSNQAKLAEPITQPGLVDSNCAPAQTVAKLSQFVQLPQGGTEKAPKTGTVDAAIAEIITGAVDTSGSILGLGTGTPPGAAAPADTIESPASLVPNTTRVAKSGRSSGVTCGTIQSIATSVIVSYSTSCGGGTTFWVRYPNDQIVVNGGSFSAEGDSGSLIVDASTAQPVALLYGGDTTSTVGNPIGDVLAALKDTDGNVPEVVGGSQHAIVCPVGSTAAKTTVPLSSQEITRAAAVSNRNATRLMATPGIMGIAIGSSEDEPGKAAIVVSVSTRDQAMHVPAQLEGIRTKIVVGSALHTEGAAQTQSIPVPHSEVARVQRVKEQVAAGLMQNRAIYGVGVGASEDSPGEAAIVIYVDKDKPSPAIPAVLNGARTRIFRSDPFRAWGWNEHQEAHSCSTRPRMSKSSDEFGFKR
jgi:hypothetical protein